MPNRRNAPAARAWLSSSSRHSHLESAPPPRGCAAVLPRPRASKMLPILTRRDAYYPLKYAAHGTHTAEPALLGNPLETVTGFLQAPASSLDTQALNELARRDAHLLAEDTGEIAGAHGHAFSQGLHAQRLVEILEHPGLQLAQGLPVAQLQGKGGAEFRLSAGPAQVQHQLTGHLERQARPVIVLNQSQRQVHSRCDAGGSVDVPVADEDRVRLDPYLRVPLGETQAPVPMGSDPAPIQQSHPRQQQRARAHRAYSPRPGRKLANPLDRLRARAIVLDGASASHQQRID